MTAIEAVHTSASGRVIIEAKTDFPTAKPSKSIGVFDDPYDPYVIVPLRINAINVLLWEFLWNIPFDVSGVVRKNRWFDVGQFGNGIWRDSHSAIAIQSQFADKSSGFSFVFYFDDNARCLTDLNRIREPNIGNAHDWLFALDERPNLKSTSESEDGSEDRDNERKFVDGLKFFEPLYGPIYRPAIWWGMLHFFGAVIITL